MSQRSIADNLFPDPCSQLAFLWITAAPLLLPRTPFLDRRTRPGRAPGTLPILATKRERPFGGSTRSPDNGCSQRSRYNPWRTPAASITKLSSTSHGRGAGSTSECAELSRSSRVVIRSRQRSLQRATQSLYHRGPDGQRHWIAPDGRVALGHARLSIIDLTTGDQPIASEDEQHPDRRQRRILRL